MDFLSSPNFQLRRPRLMMQAVRIGLKNASQNQINKIFPNVSSSRKQHLDRLRFKEAQLEESRLQRDASYSISQHIEVLIALVLENRRQQEHGVK